MLAHLFLAAVLLLTPGAVRHHRPAPTTPSPPMSHRWNAAAVAEARAAGVDTFVVRAIVEHESQGRAGVVSPLRMRCLGLMQVCPHTLAACRSDLAAPGCLAEGVRLLDGAHNLHVGVGRIVTWRAYCRRVTGRAEARHWLSGYAGADGHGVVCGQRRVGGRWRDAPAHRIVGDILGLARRLRGSR